MHYCVICDDRLLNGRLGECYYWLLYSLLLLSFDPANRYGKRRQPYFSGACGGRQTSTGSHLGHQRPPGAYIERSVYDRVHTRIGAREHEECMLYLLIDHLRRLVVRPVPTQQKPPYIKTNCV